MTGRFAVLALKHDNTALTKLACHFDVTPAANDEDADYIEWLENEAEIEDARHARW